MFLIEEKVVELQMYSGHHTMADQNLPTSDEKNSTVFRHTCSVMPLRTLKVKYDLALWEKIKKRTKVRRKRLL